MRPRRHYLEEEKRVLLATVERAHEQSYRPLSWILAELGLTRSVYYDWPGRGKEGYLRHTDHRIVLSIWQFV